MADQRPAASISKEDIEQIKDALKDGNLAEVASKIKENLQALENATVDIAVTGECGSGKSTFINAIRGLGDVDEQSAPTGVVETTLKPVPYSHPKHPTVTLWDLPGIGTPNFHPSTYLEQVSFPRYDFFILVASERFKSNHAQLAWEIQRMGKRFYFVRSKVDTDLHASKNRRPQGYDEEMVLKQIRENCQECLRREGVVAPQVFLLCSWKLDKYDFMRLEETLAKELLSHKRHAFLLTLPNISSEILQKKKKAMQKEIWKLAFTSRFYEGQDLPLLMKALCEYRKNFGLDEESLINLAKKVNKPLEDIKGVIKSPLARKFSEDLLMMLQTKGRGRAKMITAHLLTAIPLFGNLICAAMSYGNIYDMLQSFLNELAEDAKNVLIKAFESNV